MSMSCPWDAWSFSTGIRLVLLDKHFDMFNGSGNSHAKNCEPKASKLDTHRSVSMSLRAVIAESSIFESRWCRYLSVAHSLGMRQFVCRWRRLSMFLNGALFRNFLCRHEPPCVIPWHLASYACVSRRYVRAGNWVLTRRRECSDAIVAAMWRWSRL